MVQYHIFGSYQGLLAVAYSLLFLGETADFPRLFLSLALLATTVWPAEKR